MKRNFAEAARFARHVVARAADAARPVLVDLPALVVAILFAGGVPFCMLALAGMVSR